MKIIAMVDRSAGNSTVGEMWTETKVFDSSEPICNIYEWVSNKVLFGVSVRDVKCNIRLSVAQE